VAARRDTPTPHAAQSAYAARMTGGTRTLKVGINLWSQATSWPKFLEAAQLADQLGADHLWTWDHLHAIVGDPQQDIFEAYMTLGAWASATEKIHSD